jgi:hypothetical protein
MTQVPAGWYPSPDSPGQLQYWDGAGWTDFRAVAAAQAAPQPVAQPVAPQPVAQPVAQPTAAAPVAAAPVAAAPVAAAPVAAAPVSAAPVAAAGASGGRSRLIAFIGGAGLFILGLIVGLLIG